MEHRKGVTRIVHLITALEVGGAEMMLYRLLQFLQVHNVENTVVSLAQVGPVGKKIQSLGIPVAAIGIKPGTIPSIYRIAKMLRIVKNAQPNILQGWMYHGNLAANIAQLYCNQRVRLLWNVRQSLGDLQRERPLTRWVMRASALLSKSPESIIYNSRVSAGQHENFGFAPENTRFIPNGFDVNQHNQSNSKRREFRREQGIGEGVFVVGHIARFHPKKDHQTLIEAAHIVAGERSDILFVGVGRGVISDNAELSDAILSHGMAEKFRLLGERHDIGGILSSLDLLVLSSAWGEGFPNVLGEAMAAGVPCVTTDVGESATIVGDSGVVVEVGKPAVLASAILGYVQMHKVEREKQGFMARERIKEHFSIEKIGTEYLALYSR